MDNNINMNKRKEFYDKFFNLNPNFSKNLVKFYSATDGVSYAILCNYSQQNLISEKDLERIRKLSESSDVLSSFCEVFKNNSKMIELIGDYIIKTNNLSPKIEELIDFVEETNKNGSSSKLMRQNSITVYKVTEDLEISNDLSFIMDFNIEDIKTERQIKRRVYIESAESFERGKGIYSEIINNFLPRICKVAKASAIVLQASEFENDNSGKGGQEKLENFYKNNGFLKADEQSQEDGIYIKSSDFDEGFPVYYKQIEYEQIFDF